MAIVHFVNYKRGTQSRAAMRGVMLYVMQEKKTAWEGGPLVSGINCQVQSVYDDFLPRGGWRNTLTAARCWSAPM